jgi:hypothetical protein
MADTRIPLVMEPFCEVPHMAAAHIAIIRRAGRSNVILAPYTGWGYIEEFLKAGLVVYAVSPSYSPSCPLLPTVDWRRWRRILQRWQARARRKYGKGKLLTHRPPQGSTS